MLGGSCVFIVIVCSQEEGGSGVGGTIRRHTLATVAVLVELEAFCAIALVHAVVQLIAELLAGTALAASSWKDAEKK